MSSVPGHIKRRYKVPYEGCNIITPFELVKQVTKISKEKSRVPLANIHKEIKSNFILQHDLNKFWVAKNDMKEVGIFKDSFKIINELFIHEASQSFPLFELVERKKKRRRDATERSITYVQLTPYGKEIQFRSIISKSKSNSFSSSSSSSLSSLSSSSSTIPIFPEEHSSLNNINVHNELELDLNTPYIDFTSDKDKNNDNINNENNNKRNKNNNNTIKTTENKTIDEQPYLQIFNDSTSINSTPSEDIQSQLNAMKKELRTMRHDYNKKIKEVKTLQHKVLGLQNHNIQIQNNNNNGEDNNKSTTIVVTPSNATISEVITNTTPSTITITISLNNNTS